MTDHPGWASPGSSEPPSDAPLDAAPPAPYPGGYGTGAPGTQPGSGGPQPGWGQYPGWGAPPSPKPGVIPLRPLGVGEILDGAVSTVRKHWRTALGLSLGIAAVQQTLSALGQWWAYNQPKNIGAYLGVFASYPISFLLGIFATGMLTMVVSKAILGEQTSLGDAWASARPQLLRLTGLALLNFLITAGAVGFTAGAMIAFIGFFVVLATGGSYLWLIALGFLVGTAGAVVLCWLAVNVSLAAPALMLEKRGVGAALSRSRRLVRGNWWRQLGITLLSQLVIGLIGSMIAGPFMVIAMAVTGSSMFTPNPNGGIVAFPPLALLIIAIGGTVGATLTIPMLAAVRVLLYVDMRIRREALDIELARAAGLPEYGGTGWAGPTTPAGAAPVIPPQTPPPGA